MFESGCNMYEPAATCPAATCSNWRQHVRLQHVRTGGNISSCNMLEEAATCPAALVQEGTCSAGTCSNRRQHVQLQHARTGGNMSSCNMLEQAATTCPVIVIFSIYFVFLIRVFCMLQVFWSLAFIQFSSQNKQHVQSRHLAFYLVYDTDGLVRVYSLVGIVGETCTLFTLQSNSVST